ncbi:hypothetical protein BJM39_00960 [Salmonella enterica subsp. enterica serovar Javiana]|nr:hypothetical protein BJM39_00960 [Salmonella enterica subsp. enterica serovar Javiana]
MHDREEAAHDYRHAEPTPARRAVPVVVPPSVVDDGEEEDEDVAVMFAPTADEPDAGDEFGDGSVADEGDETESADAEDAFDPHEAGTDESDDAEAEWAEAHHDDDVDDADADGADADDHDDSTTEIPVSPPTGRATPAPAAPVQFDDVDGEDPGPEFEPGYPRP